MDASTRCLDFSDTSDRFNSNYNCFVGQDATSNPENLSSGQGTQLYQRIHLFVGDAGKLQAV